MQSRSKQNRRNFRRQNFRSLIRSPRGITVVEFVGCLAALGGGIVLGSIYLGVDVQTLAAGILEKADIEVPVILSADSEASTKSPVGETPEEFTDVEALPTEVDESAATLDVDLDTEESAVHLESEANADGETASEGAELKELTEAEKQAATQACWLALNECTEEEVDHRSKWMTDSQSWQLFDYLLHRQEGHQKVVETIEQLDHHGVDPRLHTHVEQVLTWHRAGAKLFDRAALLLTDAPAGKLTGPFAQSWQSAATQHRMEGKLILNKHAAVANYLEHSRKISSATSASR